MPSHAPPRRGTTQKTQGESPHTTHEGSATREQAGSYSRSEALRWSASLAVAEAVTAAISVPPYASGPPCRLSASRRVSRSVSRALPYGAYGYVARCDNKSASLASPASIEHDASLASSSLDDDDDVPGGAVPPRGGGWGPPLRRRPSPWRDHVTGSSDEPAPRKACGSEKGMCGPKRKMRIMVMVAKSEMTQSPPPAPMPTAAESQIDEAVVSPWTSCVSSACLGGCL
mmetsp:Transcript_6237/g.26149  ORF Transcript_6237/g.26149 Transcript_6237/m.26149 type:complete len:229 (+) Transcript_6237:2390-3076(+)